MKYNYACYSDIGNRDNNEDSYSVDIIDDSLLALVADGLGGHDYGEIASSNVINDIKKYLSYGIIEAIEYANKELYELNNKLYKCMYTTIAATYITKNITYLAHVGDSRIYAFKEHQIIYQSLDHSISQIAVLVGEITQQEIRTHSDRNQLTRVIGDNKQVEIDMKELLNDQYDALLLCSDGFWEYVYEEDMCQTLKEAQNPRDWLYHMREILNTRISSHNDNNTAIAIMKGDYQDG